MERLLSHFLAKGDCKSISGLLLSLGHSDNDELELFDTLIALEDDTSDEALDEYIVFVDTLVSFVPETLLTKLVK